MIPIQRTCDVENLADFSRYYGGAWVGWHSSDASHISPCYVSHLATATQITLRIMMKDDKGRFQLEAGFPATFQDLEAHIDFGKPDVGMMPDGPTVLFASYNTPRAPRKGYRARDTEISDFNGWDIRNKYTVRSALDKYDWVWFAFNPEYPTLAKAEDLLMKGDIVGVPISRTLGVYSMPKFKNSLLAYKRWTVGQVLSPYLIQIKQEYGDYEEDIATQTQAEVIVG